MDKDKLARQAIQIALRNYFVRMVEAADQELHKIEKELKLND